MTKYTGKGVYGAVAMGKISVFKKQEYRYKTYSHRRQRGRKEASCQS